MVKFIGNFNAVQEGLEKSCLSLRCFTTKRKCQDRRSKPIRESFTWAKIGKTRESGLKNKSSKRY